MNEYLVTKERKLDTKREIIFGKRRERTYWEITTYRFTNFAEINKWWEIVYSTYLMISLNTPVFTSLNDDGSNSTEYPTNHEINSHPQWNHQSGWKNVLNNLRLVIQPTFVLWLISPWLEIFPNSDLLLGFHRLIHTLNRVQLFYSSG